MDLGRLGKYLDKPRINVFLIIWNELKIGKTECFSKKPEILFNFWLPGENTKTYEIVFLTKGRSDVIGRVNGWEFIAFAYYMMSRFISVST